MRVECHGDLTPHDSGPLFGSLGIFGVCLKMRMQAFNWAKGEVRQPNGHSNIVLGLLDVKCDEIAKTRSSRS